MKKTWVKISAFVFAVALIAPVSVLAQKEEKEKVAKEEKVKEKKDVRQIIVTTKGDKDEKQILFIAGSFFHYLSYKDSRTICGSNPHKWKDLYVRYFSAFCSGFGHQRQ